MEEKKLNYIVVLASVVILAWVFLYVWNGMIKSNKENQQTSQWITNTISVMGEGKYLTQPDTFVVNVSVSELGKTTLEAQTMANEKITKLKELVKTLAIEEKSVKTTSVNVYPEYDWTNNQRKLLGYRSQHSLSIEVQGEKFAEKGSQLVDKVATVWNINIDNTSFTLKNKDAAVSKAREKAFENAKTKAADLAKFWGVTLWTPVMITDSDIDYSPMPMYNYAKAESAAGMWAADSASSSVSPWQTEITIRLNVVYEIK